MVVVAVGVASKQLPLSGLTLGSDKLGVILESKVGFAPGFEVPDAAILVNSESERDLETEEFAYL